MPCLVDRETVQFPDVPVFFRGNNRKPRYYSDHRSAEDVEWPMDASDNAGKEHYDKKWNRDISDSLISEQHESGNECDSYRSVVRRKRRVRNVIQKEVPRASRELSGTVDMDEFLNGDIDNDGENGRVKHGE